MDRQYDSCSGQAGSNDRYVIAPADGYLDWNQNGDTSDQWATANVNCLYKTKNTNQECSGKPGCSGGGLSAPHSRGGISFS